MLDLSTMTVIHDGSTPFLQSCHPSSFKCLESRCIILPIFPSFVEVLKSLSTIAPYPILQEATSMGQVQFRNSDTQKKRKKVVRPRKSDGDYIRAISDPVFLDWDNRVANQKDVVNQLEQQQRGFPVQISDYLFISNASGASNIQHLKSLGITHVINVAGRIAAWRPVEEYKEAGIQYKMVHALDEPSYPMLDNHLQECNDFIREARAQPNGKCVVHCQAGSNRSGVIVAANQMLHTGTNVLETVLHCRKFRGNGFLTNPGFQGQLVALARQERLLGPAPGQADCVVEQWFWRKVKREHNL